MAPSELAAVVQAQPFEPFRLVMSSGSTYDVDSPFRIMVGNRYVHIGVLANPGDIYPDHTIRLDLLHVTELVPLTQPKQQGGNGQKP